MLDNVILATNRILESRKYQLQKQIIEALEANDDKLYSLLKTQWAHRFGVESLEELKKLDSINSHPSLFNHDNQKSDLSKENLFDAEKTISINNDENKENEIKSAEFESTKSESDKSFQIKSHETADKENKATNSDRFNNKKPEMKALFPLPPKPKYGYLKKWLLGK